MSAVDPLDEKTLTYSINQLTVILDHLKNCADIKCVHSDTKKLLMIVLSYIDLWNKYSDNIVVLSIKSLIDRAIDNISNNRNVKYNFENQKDSDMIKMIQINIEQISSLIGVVRDVIFDMDTTKDAEVALAEYNRLNHVNLQLHELHNIQDAVENDISREEQEMREAIEASERSFKVEKEIEEHLQYLREQSALRKKELEEATKKWEESMKKREELKKEEESLKASAEECREGIQSVADEYGKYGILDDPELEGFEEYSGEIDSELEGEEWAEDGDY
jgi:chromosome segregation ATPase